MPNIIPIMMLKDTAKVSKYVSEANEPVFVTKNGYGCMVMMNMEVFENLVGTETYILKNTNKSTITSTVHENEKKYSK